MKKILAVLLLSMVAAAVVSLFSPTVVYDRYLDILIEPVDTTRIDVFFDTGKGFEAERRSRAKLAAQEGPQKVRFMLPGRVVERVRIDFSASTVNVAISGIELICLQTGAIVSVSPGQLETQSGTKRHESASGGVRLENPGRDLQATLHLAEYYSKNRINSRLVVVLTFMLYPVAWILFSIISSFVQRFLPGNSIVRPETGRHTVVSPIMLAAAVLIWLAAGWYRIEAYRLSSPVLLENQQSKRVAYAQALDAHKIQLERPDGLRIAARIYEPEAGSGPYPAFLLLHGNYPQGQKHPLYRVFARELADCGYLVMTIDFAGYGESEDPFASDSPRDLTLETEVETALEYLVRREDVQADQIGIVGHSMGADPALRVGERNQNVASIVMIGPPRRVQEQFHSPDTLGFFWHWAQKVRTQQYGQETFPYWYDRERWRNGILERDMVYMLPHLSGGKHKPLLFVDGEHEQGADQQFLREYVSRCAFPKKYVRLQKTDHDCNVVEYGEKVLYDPTAMSQLVDTVTEWHTASRQTIPLVRDALLNMVGRVYRFAVITECE